MLAYTLVSTLIYFSFHSVLAQRSESARCFDSTCSCCRTTTEQVLYTVQLYKYTGICCMYEHLSTSRSVLWRWRFAQKRFHPLEGTTAETTEVECSGAMVVLSLDVPGYSTTTASSFLHMPFLPPPSTSRSVSASRICRKPLPGLLAFYQIFLTFNVFHCFAYLFLEALSTTTIASRRHCPTNVRKMFQ